MSGGHSTTRRTIWLRTFISLMTRPLPNFPVAAMNSIASFGLRNREPILSQRIRRLFERCPRCRKELSVCRIRFTSGVRILRKYRLKPDIGIRQKPMPVLLNSERWAMKTLRSSGGILAMSAISIGMKEIPMVR